MTGQLSFFAAEAQPPSLDDVDGLLAGPGQAVISPAGASVAVVLDQPERADPLVAALARLGLAAERASTEAGRVAVRSRPEPDLLAVAGRWRHGALKAPPPGFGLDGPRLRLWCLAAGRSVPGGYLLMLGESDAACWSPVGAALSAAGLPATFLGPRGGGPAYRVVGRRRLERLRELVGEPPEGVPDAGWPHP